MAKACEMITKTTERKCELFGLFAILSIVCRKILFSGQRKKCFQNVCETENKTKNGMCKVNGQI